MFIEGAPKIFCCLPVQVFYKGPACKNVGFCSTSNKKLLVQAKQLLSEVLQYQIFFNSASLKNTFK